MITKTFIVDNKLGIHCRPAGAIATIISNHDSQVYITAHSNKVNASSILNLLMLNVMAGDKIIIEINGTDEQEVMAELTSLFDAKFNEENYI